MFLLLFSLLFGGRLLAYLYASLGFRNASIAGHLITLPVLLGPPLALVLYETNKRRYPISARAVPYLTYSQIFTITALTFSTMMILHFLLGTYPLT